MTAKGLSQLMGLPILRWEYKELYEKDEDLVLVLVNGRPRVVDSWVVVHLLAPNGTEIPVEVDRAPFDKFIFPIIFYPTLLFWRDMSPAHSLYSRRDEVLSGLMEIKRNLSI